MQLHYVQPEVRFYWTWFADFLSNQKCEITKAVLWISSVELISATMQRIFCILAIFLLLGTTFSEDIFELTTGLDDSRVRFIFHGFRNFVFNTIGRTGRKTKGSFLQEKFPESAAFPCNISIGKSKSRPHSIHKLRPGGNCSLICWILIVFRDISVKSTS